ncbi:MAG: ABC transporter substrate-binding protein [Acetobacteraceae bacterium]
MGKSRFVSRRTALKFGYAGVASAALPLVHMQTAFAAGRLKVGFWDHFVPASNTEMRKLVAEWAAKNHVDVELDLLNTTTNSSSLFVTEASESLAGTGHDVMSFLTWGVQKYHRKLEPIDDVVEGLIKQYGKIDATSEYLGKAGGHWMAVPTSYGSQNKPSCARISMFKKWGHNVQEWYPNKPGVAATAEAWTYDLMLKLAPGAQKAGLPFGLGLGITTDSVDWTGALLRAFGGVLVDAQGKMQLRSDAVQGVLEYLQKLYPYLPSNTVVYNDASNNKALISGKSALIFNPPSAWWVARRDAIKVAEDCWTFPNPAGPKARYIPYLPYFWGIWSFSQNKSAAKELITWLQQRTQVEALCDASAGYDLPPFVSMHDFTIWSTEKPPLGTVYNYPVRPWHDAETNISGYPAPAHIATELYSNATFNIMVVKLAKNKEKMKNVLEWAENEINGYMKM